ncbi:hypothetical protein D3C75_935780 [compost metagenome]
MHCGAGLYRRRQTRHDPTPHRSDEGLWIHGFGHMIDHARLGAALTVLDHGMGGHGNDRDVCVAGRGTNTPGRLETIHLRHLYVHQHRVVLRCSQHRQRLAAVAGNFHQGTGSLEKLPGNLLVDFVVLRDEQAHSGEHLRLRNGYG